VIKLLDELPCAALVTDGEGRMLFANQALLALTHLTEQACIGAQMAVLFTAASGIFLQTHVWPTTLRDGQVSEVQLQVLGQGGARTPAYLNSRRGSWQGTTAYFWTIFVARQRQEFEAALLEARNRAEESQRLQAESERFTREVADLIPSVVAYLDLDLRCRFVNKAHFDWFGNDQSTLAGMQLRDLLGDEIFSAGEPHLAGVLSGLPQSFEHSRTKLTGESADVLVNYTPQVVSGAVAGVLVVMNDITVLKNAERALVREAADRQLVLERLRSSSAWLMEAQRLGHIGSWSWEVAGDVVKWSDELFRVYGVDPELGPPCFAQQAQLYQPKSFAQLQSAVAHALATGEPYVLKLAMARPDGSTGWVDARGECVRDARGRITGLQGTVQDITARYLSEQLLAAQAMELKRSNEDLERFAYVASHDLQEPLRMVTSYGQLLTRRHAADLKPEALEFVAYMVDGGQRAQALIRDLLSLARLDSQAQLWTPVSLEATLASVLRALRLRIQETSAEVTHDALPTVVADAGQIGQLMANLVGNALKFCTEAAPRVHVGAVRCANGWRISVRDNGIGIEPRYFDRIFQMFQRLHLRSAYEGTGIGLAICKKVVERHGGHIGVESTLGQGTTFFFTMPDHARGPHATETEA
jgi:PAS domain S-box-containing protein